MDCEVKSLKRSKISLVKVRWNFKRGPEFTWEHEDYMKSKCDPTVGLLGEPSGKFDYYVLYPKVEPSQPLSPPHKTLPSPHKSPPFGIRAIRSYHVDTHVLPLIKFLNSMLWSLQD
ncbi:hypothetical protein Tco_1322681, partial [Tanacetum coccineum]